MSALVSFPVVMSTLVSFPVVMAMVVTLGIRIVLQRSFCQSLHSRVSGTGDAAIKLDPCFCKRSLSTHSNASTDQGIRLRRLQETGKRAMPIAVGWDDLLSSDLPIFHIIELKLFGMSEMLKDLSVVVRYCNSHCVCSFLFDVLRPLITELIVAAPDQETFPIYQRVSHLASGAVINSRHCGACYTHPFGTLLLGHSFPVQQTNCLKLVEAHYDRFSVGCILRREFPTVRITANPSASLFPGHRYTSFLTYVRKNNSIISDICQ